MATKRVSTADRIIVSGLREFQRELRRIQDEGGVEGRELMKNANYEVATFVIGKMKGRAATVGKQQARAASTLVAGRAQAKATVTGGSAAVPFFFGAEFGAKRNIPRRGAKRTYLGYNQFEIWKAPGGGRAGYFLFPTLKAESRNIVNFYADELDKIVKAAFPD